MLKKYLNHLSELSDIRLLVVRYAVNFVGFIEILLLPVLLDPGFYTDVEFLRYLMMLAPIFLFGAHSGFLYQFYNNKIDHIKILCLFSFLVSSVIATLIFFITEKILVSIAIFCLILVSPLEKWLVVSGKLILASVYKSFISISMIILGCVSFLYYNGESFTDIYSLSIIIGSLVWGVYLLSLVKAPFSSLLDVEGFSSFYQGVIQLVKSGFVINIQSYVLVAYFLFDRFFIGQFYSESEREYALAFSLSQIIFIGLNTIAFSAQRNIGSSIQTYTLENYSRGIKLVFMLFSVLGFVGVCGVFVLNLFIAGYGDFIYSFIITSIFYGAYYAFSSFSVVAFYKNLSFSALFILLVFMILNITLSYLLISYKGGYYLMLFKSGLLLLLSSLVMDKYIRRALK